MSERGSKGRVALAGVAMLVLGACASGGGNGVRKEAISPQRGGRTLARYTPAIRSGDFVFFSGQIGIRQGEGLAPTIEEQTRQALANLENLMEAADVSKEDLVKCTVFLADIRDY
ncbi:MAG: RidA family protein, partial [Longimicrobiales bacterium]